MNEDIGDASHQADRSEESAALANKTTPGEVSRLKERIRELEGQMHAVATAWDQVQLSRHEQRPYTLDYLSRIFTSFREIHGDRRYADDKAIVGGMALLDGSSVMVIGQQKGRNTKERLYRNYGMPRPEGYRKALRLMRLAEKFGRPILCFVDTPGAYPGIGAEERGQAQAIAENLLVMAQIRVPIIVTVLGEGGSGGALAIGKPGAHAGAFHLFGDFTRELFGHPVEGSGARPRGGRGAQAECRTSASVRGGGRDRA